jgi:plasmid stabilization system protein ParE
MSSTLLFAAPALRDLDALFDMIAEDSPARAARFIMRIGARCERPETFPHSGRARPESGPVCARFLYGPWWYSIASTATSCLWRVSSTVGEISGRSTSSIDLAIGLYRFDDLGLAQGTLRRRCIASRNLLRCQHG